ncbi:uncharacterized protein BDV17DRAFT_3929 [Aspergillus undulatus]|uniref:uncharacterized protein n=1 Tax=Aspergillus undulatus TaxID=1810928 RepID=UPI003CCE4459
MVLNWFRIPEGRSGSYHAHGHPASKYLTTTWKEHPRHHSPNNLPVSRIKDPSHYSNSCTERLGKASSGSSIGFRASQSHVSSSTCSYAHELANCDCPTLVQKLRLIHRQW